MAIGERLVREIGPIRVINLPRRTDRRAEVQAELAGLGLALGPATANVPAAIFPAVRPDDAAGFPTIGTRGCFLSHLGVLRQALAEDAESVLILEDDVTFPRDAVARLPAVLDALAGVDWTIFYGGYRMPAAPEAAAAGIAAIPPATAVVTAHCIAFRRPAIKLLVPYLEAMLARPPGSPEGGPMHVDGAYSWFRAAHPQFRTIATVPEIAHQRASRTDIHDLKLYDRLPIVRDVVQGLRRLRRG
ncbi:glycosyltransferase family 25 protein [Edaphosphingomonas haloaromaticamans]|uniref:Glycosyltransferase family 25 (LPS biosynthesis protein) n=1 Tax=Edaphosphingomonas haloaromaticamans TaxID=653954 RepID=A0A1S1HFA9_9SPHN|nr:glycosyltransferase family 25 protein [Sphingomonas haloaromaticamans]OHT20827.1 Glycosyltransferase family 25 (LPS biosynthesis protein) [Sphingomonas haloaromaticamans]